MRIVAADKGEFAVRGGIVDLYPVNSPDPFRIEFWGDTVESIRIYDPVGQKTVRTIEVCTDVSPVRGGSVFSHYILHVVGYLEDVSEIVFEVIHKPMELEGLRCGTRVLPIADVLARDAGLALSETSISDDQVHQKRIAEIIEGCIEERAPFVVKKLDRDTLELVCAIWDRADRWRIARQARTLDTGVLKKSRLELIRCLYYCAYALRSNNGTLDDASQSGIWHYCGEFYREFAAEIEHFLGRLIFAHAERTGEAFMSAMKSAWESGSKKGDTFTPINLTTIPIGTSVQGIIYWNEN